ncbi:ribosomal protein S6e-domain-containing protein [Mycena olivaceomarginata]|nr:ribosomal protein S6e-domain-containing protein [Mycena olivaceomarginata]
MFSGVQSKDRYQHRYPVFYDKKIAQEVPANTLGSEWAGYILRITGGNDEQGFPMKQGVLLPYRIKLLLSDGHSCYRPCRIGERKRNIAVLSVVLVKQDEGEIVGLTDNVLLQRVNKIQRFFNLIKEDITGKKEGEAVYQGPQDPAPGFQVTPIRLQCPRHLKSLIRRRTEHQKEHKAEFEYIFTFDLHFHSALDALVLQC